MTHRFITMLTTLLLVIASAGASNAGQQATTCNAFTSWEWAQTAYEANPEALDHLVPDDSDIACPDLPHGGIVPALWADRIPPSAEPAQLDAIVDGDTFYAQTPAGRDRIRMYHIDSPETGSLDQPSQCGADEATQFLGSVFGQVPEGTVHLEYDVTQRDEYDRRLAYVWFERDGDVYVINEIMVRAGWAESETFAPDDRYKPEIDEAADFAERHQLGVYDTCGGFAQPPLPTLTPVPASAGSTGDCDPSYPTVCIPPQWQVGDLDCGDINERRFEVLPPDPHRFDGNADGVGCEGS